MNKVIIKDLRIYAFHGVLPQENKIGAYFTLNIEMTTDFTKAMESDDLDGTINYAEVLAIVKREMAVPSKLMEHVGGRIITALFRELKAIQEIRLQIIKENPPMGADCGGAGIEIVSKRQ